VSIHDELLAAGGTDCLVAALGDPGAVRVLGKNHDLATATSYAAIVGSLRVAEVELIPGTLEHTEQQETCQVSIHCPPGTIHLESEMVIAKYTTGDASTHVGQSFHVQTIERVTAGLTTVQAARAALSKIQRRGLEGPR
jgi:hypothetical protein